MNFSLLLVIGVGVAIFVVFNIGGSSTGVAFGPAVGSGVVSKGIAAGLLTGFALLGGWTVGRRVIETIGGQIVPSSQFTLTASVGDDLCQKLREESVKPVIKHREFYSLDAAHNA